MTTIYGKLDFYGSGELNGSFLCLCGVEVAFLGSPTARSEDLDSSGGFTLWVGESFEKHSSDLKCLKCGAVYDLVPTVQINIRE